LIEQNALLALEAAHRAYVMPSGAITLSGDAKSLLHDPRIREADLGEARPSDHKLIPATARHLVAVLSTHTLCGIKFFKNQK